MASDGEKVELEAVPLKSDTDAPAEPETKTEAPVAPKKTWFFSKKTTKKTEENEEKSAEEGTAGEEKKECCKKKCWWRREKGEKSEDQQKAEHISIGINLVDRDEKQINDHVKFGFEDIFGEADSAHSWDCIWRLVYRIFTWTRLFVYRLGALLIGIPAAIVFGILFALFTVLNVFACVPLGKLLTIPATWIAKTWKFIIEAILDPVHRSIGLVWSRITTRTYGINSQPTDMAIA
ncbi:unnamed protein product, partial [Mesorhabditis belari]|uniref:Caveolin n=1 Tax=Mesorhabditis belari TaxID=2138241 RepID=A0AAF3FF99_9BILA